ncbi:MAG: diaminopimelate epimerase [Halofilum sp. (in: g-proteobacteria)]
MGLAFTKMHGLGNDFVVLDGVRQRLDLSGGDIRRLADRHRGVGCDQVLTVESCADDTADFRYRIFNADGSEAGQCGNGARCVARFVREQGLTDAVATTFATVSGPIQTRVLPDERVTVDMGAPRFAPAEIPFEASAQQETYALDVAGAEWTVAAVSMGNPHAVIEVADVDSAPVATAGPAIEHHPRFPAGANVGFMQVLAPDRVRLRVWERGVGETSACGSGACAAAAVGRLRGRLGEAVSVQLPGGELVIEWPGPDNPLWMTGPAETAFLGTLPW